MRGESSAFRARIDQRDSVYQELRGIAARALRQGRSGSTSLHPTALVHEAYLKLAEVEGVGSHSHVMALAARAMRQVLVDEARRRRTQRRGGDANRVVFHENLGVSDESSVPVDPLLEALEELERSDSRAAQVVELRFFGGLSERQVAQLLDCSERTVRNDWRAARAWLRARVGELVE